MQRKQVDYARIAARFRLYAEACRHRAEMRPKIGDEMFARAVRWENDADQVERDGKLVAEPAPFRGASTESAQATGRRNIWLLFLESGVL